jgi:glyoxylase-like metal-dependent hydrolase (beta-lactamase superfamily II)
MTKNKHIFIMDVDYGFFGNNDTIHPVILKDGKDMVLVDCGCIGYLPRMEEAVRRAGLRCESLTRIVITHHDHDHMGTLAALRRKYPSVKIVAHQSEAPYITGKKKSLRLEQAEALQPTLPDEQKSFGEAFIDVLKSVEPAPVDILVDDGDTFGWFGGCRVIHTPGHTTGHISLHLESHSTVITGDAAVVENGLLAVANPAFAQDLPLDEQSLSKLLMLNAVTYICYHGGVWRNPHQ